MKKVLLKITLILFSFFCLNSPSIINAMDSSDEGDEVYCAQVCQPQIQLQNFLLFFQNLGQQDPEEALKILLLLYLRELIINNYYSEVITAQYGEDSPDFDNAFERLIREERELYLQLKPQTQALLESIEEHLSQEGAGFNFNNLLLLLQVRKNLAETFKTHWENITNPRYHSVINDQIIEPLTTMGKNKAGNPLDYIKNKVIELKKQIVQLNLNGITQHMMLINIKGITSRVGVVLMEDKSKDLLEQIHYLSSPTIKPIAEVCEIFHDFVQQIHSFINNKKNFKRVILPEDVSVALQTLSTTLQNLGRTYDEFSEAFEIAQTTHIELQKEMIQIYEESNLFKEVYSQIYDKTLSSLPPQFLNPQLPSDIFLFHRILNNASDKTTLNSLANYFEEILCNSSLTLINPQIPIMRQLKEYEIEETVCRRVLEHLLPAIKANPTSQEIPPKLSKVSIQSPAFCECIFLSFNAFSPSLEKDALCCNLPLALTLNHLLKQIKSKTQHPKKTITVPELPQEATETVEKQALSSLIPKRKAKRKIKKQTSSSSSEEEKQIQQDATPAPSDGNKEDKSKETLDLEQDICSTPQSSPDLPSSLPPIYYKRKPRFVNITNEIFGKFFSCDRVVAEMPGQFVTILQPHEDMTTILYLGPQNCGFNTSMLELKEITKHDKFHAIPSCIKEYLNRGIVLTHANLAQPGCHHRFHNQLRLEPNQFCILIEAKILPKFSYSYYSQPDKVMSIKEYCLEGMHSGTWVFVFDAYPKGGGKCVHQFFHEYEESRALNPPHHYCDG